MSILCLSKFILFKDCIVLDEIQPFIFSSHLFHISIAYSLFSDSLLYFLIDVTNAI